MNWIVVILTAPVGFFVGLAASWVVELVSLGHWILAAVAVAFFAFLFFFEAITDRIFDPLFNRLFRVPKQAPAQSRTERHRSMIAFAIGFALAVVASWIWSAKEIVGLL